MAKRWGALAKTSHRKVRTRTSPTRCGNAAYAVCCSENPRTPMHPFALCFAAKPSLELVVWRFQPWLSPNQIEGSSLVHGLLSSFRTSSCGGTSMSCASKRLRAPRPTRASANPNPDAKFSGVPIWRGGITRAFSPGFGLNLGLSRKNSSDGPFWFHFSGSNSNHRSRKFHGQEGKAPVKGKGQELHGNGWSWRCSGLLSKRHLLASCKRTPPWLQRADPRIMAL